MKKMNKDQEQLKKLIAPDFNASWSTALKDISDLIDKYASKFLLSGSWINRYLGELTCVLSRHFHRCCNIVLNAIKKQIDANIMPRNLTQIREIALEILVTEKEEAQKNLLIKIGEFYSPIQNQEDYLTAENFWAPKLKEANNAYETKLIEEIVVYLKTQRKKILKWGADLFKSILATKWFWVTILGLTVFKYKNLIFLYNNTIGKFFH